MGFCDGYRRGHKADSCEICKGNFLFGAISANAQTFPFNRCPKKPGSSTRTTGNNDPACWDRFRQDTFFADYPPSRILHCHIKAGLIVIHNFDQDQINGRMRLQMDQIFRSIVWPDGILRRTHCYCRRTKKGNPSLDRQVFLLKQHFFAFQNIKFNVLTLSKP